MSDSVGWPYTVLGLESSDVQKGDIRKAYARRLKKIDQANDPSGFQELRQAYEAALRFCEAPPATDEDPEFELAEAETITIDAADLEEFLSSGNIFAHKPTASEAKFSDAEFELIERVAKFSAPESDIARLTAILNDPLMADPAVADAVEYEIYDFLYKQIDDETGAYPGFALRGASGMARNPPDSPGLSDLIETLDERFGWMSDQVRMQNKFYGFDRFIYAATYLGRMKVWSAPQVAQKSGWDYKTLAWVGILVVFIAARLVSVMNEPQPSFTPSVDGRQHMADWGFVTASPGASKPTPETVSLLERIARTQHFTQATNSEVGMIIARNWAKRATEGDLQWRTQNYANLEELKYMTGVMLSIRYQVELDFGYRSYAQFNLVWSNSRGNAKWWVGKKGLSSNTIWGAGSGYMLAEYQRPDTTTYRAVYPQEYVDKIRNLVGNDLRVLEGALGIKAYALEQRPLKFFQFDKITFQKTRDQLVDIEFHAINKTSLGQNRWPIRATTLPVKACKVMTIQDDGVNFATIC